MKSFNKQNEELIEFNKIFDSNIFQHCVTRAMLLIKNREAQMTEEGYIWNIETNTCKWAIEQAILNRGNDVPMMAAAIEYVESIEHRAESYNNLTKRETY